MNSTPAVEAHLKRTRRAQLLGMWGLRLITLITALPVIGIIVYIFYRGAGTISWEFLTAMPTNGMRSG
ncbi:MAG TPA: phosphate ABC transporter, permease protein PstA, partial [Bellilinea sp.]|nr:phosphate ABC transporter, permease protein PstA [Bellilinea sp.]